MITLIATALLALTPAAGHQPEPPVDPGNIQYLVDLAPDTCAKVEAFRSTVGRDPDVDRSLELFAEAWAGVPGLDELSALYRGIVVGCIADQAMMDDTITGPG